MGAIGQQERRQGELAKRQQDGYPDRRNPYHELVIQNIMQD